MRRYILTAVAAALAAGLAMAQAPAATRPARANSTGGILKAGIRQRIVKNLGLTAAQKEQVKTILQNANQTAKPIRQAAQQNREAINAAVKSNNTGQIQQLAGVGGNIQGQLLANRAEARAKLYAILTPDQQAKLAAMEERLRGALGKRAAKTAAP